MLKSGGSLPVVSLPLHRPATGWDASGILKQPAPPTTRFTDNPPHRQPVPPTNRSTDEPLHRQPAPPTNRSTDNPLHRQPVSPTTRSHYNPLHGPADEMVFRAGAEERRIWASDGCMARRIIGRSGRKPAPRKAVPCGEWLQGWRGFCGSAPKGSICTNTSAIAGMRERTASLTAWAMAWPWYTGIWPSTNTWRST